MRKAIIILSLMVNLFGFSQVIDTGDKVGIGITSPQKKLHINAPTDDGIAIGSGNAIIGDSGSGSFTQLLFWNGANIYYGRDALGGSVSNHYFRTGGTNRMFIGSNGNIGIGTTTPISRFHVEGTNIAGETGITIKNRDASVGTRSVIDFITTSTNTVYGSLGVENTNLGAGAMTFSTRGGTFEKMRITSSGKVGIGTTNPNEKLEVNGNILLPNTGWLKANTNTGSSKRILGMNTNNDIYIGGVDSGTQHVNIRTNGANRLHISSSGNVGIGTINTKGFKLGVQGTIAAEEVKVATYANWSDFVFKSNYNLPTLKEVEKHIKEKGHLKDIPSAEEVKKEGFFLGEMDAKLLQKIEELTLYAIDQEKRIEYLEVKNEKLITLIEKILEAKVEK